MSIRSLIKVSKAYLADSSANVAVLFSLSAVVLAGAAGMAVDYSRATNTHASYQAVLDNAVLAGVTSSEVKGEQVDAANTFFAAHIPNSATLKTVTFTHQNDNLVATANVKLKTMLLGVLGISNVDVVINSSASKTALREPLCFMAMHPTRKHTLELKGSVSVIAPNCNIYGNSDHINDVVDPHTPQNFLTGKSVQAIGWGHHYLQNVTPPLEYAPEVIPDPLLSIVIPSSGGGCDFANGAFDGATVTLNPGVYCNGLQIKGGAKITLNPGIYIIEKEFNMEDATITGDGVTIVLADRNVEMDLNKANLQLSAPKTGVLKGMVIVGVREETQHRFENSVLNLHGVVYIPKGKIEWVNDGIPVITAKWTAWIVDGVTWTGNGTININFNLADSDIPYPNALRVIPRPSTIARLIK